MATIPAWAERVLENAVKGVRDPRRLERWSSLALRFRARWEELEADKWNIPASEDGDGSIRASVLACAVACALEGGPNNQPPKVREAANELDSLNEKISASAELLADLLQQRETLKKDYVLNDNQEEAKDAIVLWDALELAAEEFPEWAGVAGSRLEDFLRIAREQSRPGPEWENLLYQLSDRLYCEASPVSAADVAAFASKTNRTDFSTWGLRLIARLGNARMFYGRAPLDHLKNDQLAKLAEITFDAPEEAFNGEQMRKLKTRYFQRVNAPDDSFD